MVFAFSHADTSSILASINANPGRPSQRLTWYFKPATHRSADTVGGVGGGAPQRVLLA
jgi:hypothetical protein